MFTDSSKFFLKTKKKYAFLALCVIILAGCHNEPPLTDNAYRFYERPDQAPRSYAVLPVNNLTKVGGIEHLVRKSLYSQLSTLPYRDVELLTVDRRLREHGIADQKTLAKAPVKRLGRILGCDAVIFASIYECQRVFAGIYSSVNVGISIQIWDARTAQKLWYDRYTARTHEGGVPLSIISLPFIAFRAGWNLREEIKIQAVDETCRHLVQRIPFRRQVQESQRFYIVQVGAFSEEKRALLTNEQFKQKGFPAFIRQKNDERGAWHRVLLGPYKNLEKALMVQKQIREEFGKESLISIESS